MQTLKKYNIHLKGITPLLMHSDILCNPLHPIAKQIKEISKLKAKKDEHYLAMSKLEWEAGLYYSEDLGIYMPSKCLMGSLKSAAKKDRQGKAIKAVTIDAAIGVPLLPYEGKKPADLWEVKNKSGEQVYVHMGTVVVVRARILRTRPYFPKWEVKFDTWLSTDLMSEEEMIKHWNIAGFECGLCDLRPEKATGTFGKFEVVDIKRY